MGFHFGEVKVWTGTQFNEFVGIVEEVETEIEKTATDGF
jgi:hypothetical protein